MVVSYLSTILTVRTLSALTSWLPSGNSATPGSKRISTITFTRSCNTWKRDDLEIESKIIMLYRWGCAFDEVPVAVQGHQHHREVLQEPHHLIVMACCRAFSDLSWSSSYLFSVGIVHLHLGLEDVSVLHTAHREEVVNGRTQQFNLKANFCKT